MRMRRGFAFIAAAVTVLLGNGVFVRAAIVSDPNSVANQTFDFIVCGGGLTGLTVASRLTEALNTSVLVIEGGNDDHTDPRVASVSTYGAAIGSQLDYGFFSTPVAAQNNNGQRLVLGHTLGGSGSINGATWTKGSRTQYDLIASLVGDSSWGWNALNQYMLHAEHFFPPTAGEAAKGAQYISADHDQSGNVHVAFGQGMQGNVQLQSLASSRNVWAGLAANPDAASGTTTGTTFFPHMFDDGYNETRSSPFTAYVQNQISSRPNFTILTGNRVVEILWQNSTTGQLAAAGVKFQACYNCLVYSAHSKREVLLAAGALQSPQLLELSGVGDPAVLTAAGVPVKLAIPGVGRNLQEQTKTTISYKLKDSTTVNATGLSNAIAYPNVQHLFGNVSTATHNTIVANLSSYAKDLESRALVANANATCATLKAQVDDLWHNQNLTAAAEVLFYINPSARTFNAEVWNLIPLSRGTVHITNNNSWTPPAVNPSYFFHPHDLQTQATVSAQTRLIFQTQPLASLLGNETSPGLSAVPQGASHAAWEQWTQEHFTSVWHFVATLSMGDGSASSEGVVDSTLRIPGIQNLRVIDASTVPVQLSAHLSSTLYGVAEKAANLIKADYSGS